MRGHVALSPCRLGGSQDRPNSPHSATRSIRNGSIADIKVTGLIETRILVDTTKRNSINDVNLRNSLERIDLRSSASSTRVAMAALPLKSNRSGAFYNCRKSRFSEERVVS